MEDRQARPDHPETSPQAASAATLWVVATPLGHLEDLSPRAQSVLENAPIVAAEDTRISRRLVPNNKDQRWISVNEHTEKGWIERIIESLLSGQDVALVSDAGTPLISDPGFRLVSAAHDHGIRVSPVPGPCAAIAALSVAGLASDRFHFEGFLPPRSGARQARLRQLASLESTLIFYVPARDLLKALKDMSETLGPERLITLARELTKQFETIRRDSVAALSAWIEADSDQCRGEAVLVVEGASDPEPMISPQVLAEALRDSLPPSQAARLLGRVSGLSRQQAWQWIHGDGAEPTDHTNGAESK
ncbi:MAG TPA: 16S rRNA (cytidine(1402)-2'-O)-methyltransferase [Wenzhouxiangella sp.]